MRGGNLLPSLKLHTVVELAKGLSAMQRPAAMKISLGYIIGDVVNLLIGLLDDVLFDLIDVALVSALLVCPRLVGDLLCGTKPRLAQFAAAFLRCPSCLFQFCHVFLGVKVYIRHLFSMLIKKINY